MVEDRRSRNRSRRIGSVAYRSASVRGHGHLANFSETGVFVRATLLPAPGEWVQLTFEEVTPLVALEAEVRWAGPRHDGVVGFGARLVNPPEAYLELLRSLAAVEPCDDGPRRVAPRIDLSVPVAVEMGTTCDDGTLCDISLSGARLERTGIRPMSGDRVSIVFGLKGFVQPFEIIARVVRPTDSGGYAVQFEAIDPKLKATLEAALSVLHALPSSETN
jgi:hypothetical protein